MNNTTTTRTKLNLTIVAIFMAATLVVGIGTFTTTTTTTQSVYAYQKKGGGEDNGKGNGNGNTVTIEECKNRSSASGFDTNLDQECENVICTHPGNNATCVQEGALTSPTTTTTTTATTPPTPKTCEECLTTFLTPQQITALVVKGVEQCELSGHLSEDDFRFVLSSIGVSGTTADELIACLKNVGFVFLPPV